MGGICLSLPNNVLSIKCLTIVFHIEVKFKSINK